MGETKQKKTTTQKSYQARKQTQLAVKQTLKTKPKKPHHYNPALFIHLRVSLVQTSQEIQKNGMHAIVTPGGSVLSKKLHCTAQSMATGAPICDHLHLCPVEDDEVYKN